ncbi:MAG: DapH/DapD/GlmU-related protein [Bacteroidia bacterium]|nr:DapH/DapD/GlmU-related protein [Bacteroidia bacterium]
MALYKKIYASTRIWRYRLLSGKSHRMEGKPILHQPLLIQGNGLVRVGERVHLGYELSADFWSGYTYLDLRGKGALIEIGEDVMINNSASLTADGSVIKIGRKTIAGVHLSIETGDGHSLHPEKRHSGDFPRLPVIIGENVFIGDRVTILKGVTIGDNTVIGSNSIVTKDIPANVVAAGNPCRVLHPLK